MSKDTIEMNGTTGANNAAEANGTGAAGEMNGIKVIEGGVNRVHILDGRIPHCLLLEIFTDRGCGTAIMNPEETRYYNR